MIRPARIAPVLVVLTAASAWAQDSVSISSTDPGPIGIDACLAQTSTQFTMTGTISYGEVVDERSPTYRFYYYTGDAPCRRSEGLDNCGSPVSTTDADGNACGCFYETTTLAGANFSTTTTLRTALSNYANSLCDDNAPSRVNFIGELYYPSTDNLVEESIISSPVAVTVDRTRPGAPSDIPRVTGVESALVVTADGITEGSVSYEVCVRLVGATSDVDPGGTTTNEALREGFTCASAGSSVSSFRFEGLTNDVNYEVVYAAVDEALNRGPNSPSATGRPQPQRDFAEQYTAQLGGQSGETGGCAATPAGGPSPLGWLTLGLLALIRRRRP